MYYIMYIIHTAHALHVPVRVEDLYISIHKYTHHACALRSPLHVFVFFRTRSMVHGSIYIYIYHRECTRGLQKIRTSVAILPDHDSKF
jgi:hypothetical protein